MENQNLLAAWNEMQTRVETCIALQLEARDREVAAKQSKLRKRARWSPVLDIVVSGLALLLTGGYAAAHIQALLATPWLALPTLLVYAIGILQINMAVRQLIALSDLDYSKPVLETQACLAELRKLRFISTKWTLSAGIAFWFVPLILLWQMAAGPQVLLKLAESTGVSWLVGNAVFGLASGAGMLWFAAKSKFAPKLQDALVGKDILEAESFLKQIEAFRQS